MRKLVYVVVVVVGVLTMAVAVASGAKSPHRVLRCKPHNSSAICLPPQTSIAPLSVACHKTAHPAKLPKIKIKANAGIRKITIKLDRKTVKTFKFKGRGPTQKVIRGYRLKLAGLKAGVHTVKITTVDKLGKKSSRTRHIAICKPVPKFTG